MRCATVPPARFWPAAGAKSGRAGPGLLPDLTLAEAFEVSPGQLADRSNLVEGLIVPPPLQRPAPTLALVASIVVGGTRYSQAGRQPGEKRRDAMNKRPPGGGRGGGNASGEDRPREAVLPL